MTTSNNQKDDGDYTETIDSVHGIPPSKDIPDEEQVVAPVAKTSSSMEEQVPTSAGATTKPKNKEARLHWENINLQIDVGKEKKLQVLENVWGEAPQGEVTAIMGPSGSGKTSLLNVLSGRMTNSTKNAHIDADHVTWNGRALDVTDLGTRQTIAFVAQDDSLPVTSTPREAIMFSARLRLDKHKTMEEISEITETMLAQLHLLACADTLVGGALLKGISGGERKRTSVGVELVTRPKLVFLDEPTSGLDSFNALELLRVLQQVASTGSAVMLTIHQPSSEIWETFDRLMLLKKGKVMYEGRRELVNEKFSACGYPLPPDYNPADWIMYCAQSATMETLEKAGFFPVNDFSAHGKKLQQDNAKALASQVSKLDAAAPPSDRVGFKTQVKWLFARELKHLKRNTHPLRTRTAMTVVISLLCGVLFFEAAKQSYDSFINLQTAFGALMLAMMANMFSTTLPALVAFPEERPVFLREYSAGCYSVVAYFIARLTMEICITAAQVTVSTLITYFMVGFTQNYGLFWLVTYVMALASTALGVMIGSAVSEPSVAIELLPAVFMPQILFAGFFIPKEKMPDWLAWLTYIFPLTYAVRLVLVYEFDGSCDEYSFNTCNELLTNTDADPDDVWWYWLVLSAQFVFFRLLALFILQQKAGQFY